MKITFYGVRGSTPSPSRDTIKYGGNTSCIYIELDDHRSLILDAGTGLRELGKQLSSNKKEFNILLSHAHWDHIQGYPFFIPLYQPQNHINLYSGAKDGTKFISSIYEQFNGLNFPLEKKEIPSTFHLHALQIENVLAKKNIQIQQKELNHHGGGSAYKISEQGMTVAYVTDNELDPPYAQNTSYQDWVEFLLGVDVLIHDAQYTQNDMPHKHGWGHSLISQVRQLAIDAEVRALVMFHHDPDRTDAQLDEIQIENERLIRVKQRLTKSICAAEGMQIELSRSIQGGETQIKIS